MSGATGIIAFIIMLLIMVTFHELGHYTAARIFRIKVEQFFVGFGPRLFSWRRGETEYGLRAILLGGYVRIAGMSRFQTISPEDAPRSFQTKPAWQRVIVLAAGSATHFVLAMLLFTIFFGALGIQEPTNRIRGVVPKINDRPSPALTSGFESGDTIVRIDDKKTPTWDDVSETIRESPGRSLAITILRNQSQTELEVTPALVATGEGTIGQIGILPHFRIVRENPLKSLQLAAETTGQASVQSVQALRTLFSSSGLSRVVDLIQGERRTVNDPIGVVGGAIYTGEVAASGGIRDLIVILGGLVIIIGITNLLPIPPFDGGHIVIVLVEKIVGRELPPRLHVSFSLLGWLLVLSLVIALFYLDVVQPVTRLP